MLRCCGAWLRGSMIGALLIFVTACAERTESDQYFPLNPGRVWTYAERTTLERGATTLGEAVHRTLPAQDFDGSPSALRRSDSGMTYWLRRDDSGVYRVAAKSDLQAEPEADSPRRYVLKAPLQVGSSWQASTTAYLLQRTQEFPKEIRHTHPRIPMSYQIVAVGKSAEVAAGVFSDCIEVRGVAVVRLYADPVVGWRDMELITQETYCKGVGLVRLTRSEPANSNFLVGGSYSMELTSWQ